MRMVILHHPSMLLHPMVLKYFKQFIEDNGLTEFNFNKTYRDKMVRYYY